MRSIAGRYDRAVMSPGEPASQVFEAFGADFASRERLDGGRGQTWRAGDVVLRPTAGGSEADWRAEVLRDLRHTTEFRTPRPIRAVSGAWVVDTVGRALQWRVPGAADETRVSDVLRAGAAFHDAVAELPRPCFLETSDDPWALADRMSWDERPLLRDPMLDRLAAQFRPVQSPSQVIHGDLLGNVLFAEGHPPTIIDWAPYWRPAGLGSAIAVVDALCWHGTPGEAVAELGADVPEWSQLVVRALTFRIATFHLLGLWDMARSNRYAPVVDAAVNTPRAVGLAADACMTPPRPGVRRDQALMPELAILRADWTPIN